MLTHRYTHNPPMKHFFVYKKKKHNRHLKELRLWELVDEMARLSITETFRIFARQLFELQVELENNLHRCQFGKTNFNTPTLI